jgi:hypothetical protein
MSIKRNTNKTKALIKLMLKMRKSRNWYTINNEENQKPLSSQLERAKSAGRKEVESGFRPLMNPGERLYQKGIQMH